MSTSSVDRDRTTAWLGTLHGESPDQPEVVALIDALDAHQRALYPPESNHLLGIEALRQPDVRFVVARDAAGRAVACGAVLLRPNYGEIKRMFVSPSQRGRGLATVLLRRLEREAAAHGCLETRLETGVRQPEALALYARCGYERCAAFGDYPPDDPLSVFLRKSLVA